MIVFDLDGTLALDHHRSHFLQGDTKYWDEYFNACEHDEPNRPIIGIVKTLYLVNQDRIGLWTGRSEKVYDLTMKWLDEQNILHCFADIRMRPSDDRTQDDILKMQWAAQAHDAGDPVNLVFEDRQRVVDMWRRLGITCCQVAPGAF